MHRTAAAPRVHISAGDDHLTGFAGLLLSGELIRRTRLVAGIDGAVEGVRAFKERHRGRSAGELLVSLAETMMAGGNHLAHLEVLRQDAAGAGLRAVAETPAPTTAGQLRRRLTVAQLRAVLTATAEAGNVLDAELGLAAAARVTLDIDATTTEVYGRQKQGAAFNYEGRFSYKSQLVTWAERHRILAVELSSGNSAAKPSAPRLLEEALARLPHGHGERCGPAASTDWVGPDHPIREVLPRLPSGTLAGDGGHGVQEPTQDRLHPGTGRPYGRARNGPVGAGVERGGRPWPASPGHDFSVTPGDLLRRHAGPRRDHGHRRPVSRSGPGGPVHDRAA